MAFTGTIVTSGRGRGYVVATGNDTELGSIAGLIRGADPGETPLKAKMDGKKLTLTDENGRVAIVTIADVKQSNGVIHVIDHVLLPKM